MNSLMVLGLVVLTFLVFVVFVRFFGPAEQAIRESRRLREKLKDIPDGVWNDTPLNVAPGLYRHFRGGYYEVIGVGTHTETGERLVAYKSIFSSSPVLHFRPLIMFIETLEVDENQVRRFTRIEE